MLHSRPLRVLVVRLSVLLLVGAGPSATHAQWRNIAPTVLPNMYSGTFDYGGVLLFRDGLLIAGKHGVMYSLDTGLTWRSFPPTLPTSSLMSVDIFDRSNILLTFDRASIERSTDGGATWSSVPGAGVSGFGLGAIFLDAPDHILVADVTRGLSITLDGGMTWKSAFGASHWFSQPIYNNGTIYAPQTGEYYSASEVTQLVSSSDLGATWSTATGTADWDSYGLAIDKCQDHTLYLTNEDAVRSIDNMSNIFRTTDDGATWRSVAQATTNTTTISPYFTGGISTAPLAVYVQTRPEGVRRSTDHGRTWQSVGGPNVGYDSRFLFALTSNTVFAVDSEGSVWRTDNSGGFPVSEKDPTLSTHSLFANDSLWPCDNAVTQTVTLLQGACATCAIRSIRIVGNGASSYTASQSGDQITVTFSPSKSGDRPATLIVELSSGTTESVILRGFVRTPMPLTLSTANQSTTVIGDLVQVPIEIGTFRQSMDVTLILHYDPRLSYRGSVDNSNIPIDIAGEAWIGRSKLLLKNASGSGKQGVATFTVWAGSSTPFEVKFDSLTVPDPAVACQYSTDSVALATVQGSHVCGDSLIGHFMQYGSFELSVSPNPVHKTLTVRLSPVQRSTSVMLIDRLGRVVAATDGSRGVVSFDVTELPDGTYTCLARSASGMASRSIVILHP